MAFHLKWFILVLTCAFVSACSTGERFKFKSQTKPMFSSQPTQLRNDTTNQTHTCNLTYDQSVVETLSRLTQDSAINIVVLRLHFGSKNESRSLSDLELSLANTVGREILQLLKLLSDPGAITTLTVGRTILDVQVYVNPQGCIPASEENGTHFVAKTLLHKLLRTVNTEYQLCYGKTDGNYFCYKIKEKGQLEKYHLPPSYLTVTIVDYYAVFISVEILFFNILFALLIGFVATSYESSRDKKYYKTTDSPMSPSSLFYTVFLKGCGPVKSFVRRLIFIGLFLWFSSKSLFNSHSFADLWMFIIFAVIFPFSNLFKIQTHLLSKRRKLHELSPKMLSFFLSKIKLFLIYEDYRNAVYILTMPFNIKRWRNKIVKNFFQLNKGPACNDLLCHEEIWLFLKNGYFYFKAVLCCLVAGFIALLHILLIINFQVVRYAVSIFFFAVHNTKRKQMFVTVFLVVTRCYLLLFLMGNAYICFLRLPIMILSFFAGLILNAVYFIPYITFISVLIFYSMTFWKTLETKYFILKIQIYEICKEKLIPDDDEVACDSEDDGDDDNGDDNDDNGDDNDDDNESYTSYVNVKRALRIVKMFYLYGDNEDDCYACDVNRQLRISTKWKYNHNNEPMISKQLYDQIRERLLPYNLSLFVFFFKVLFVFLFAYFMFAVVTILQTSDISGTVKIIMTMSVSVVPYIFNIVAAKISEEENKAQNEVQKIKVEKLVCELTEGRDQVYEIYQNMSDDELMQYARPLSSGDDDEIDDSDGGDGSDVHETS